MYNQIAVYIAQPTYYCHAIISPVQNKNSMLQFHNLKKHTNKCKKKIGIFSISRDCNKKCQELILKQSTNIKQSYAVVVSSLVNIRGATKFL